MIKSGVPLRKIVQKAKEEFNEDFTHMSLSRHSRNHMNQRKIEILHNNEPTTSIWRISIHKRERRLTHSPRSLGKLMRDHPIEEEYYDTIDQWHRMLRESNEY